MTGDPGEPVETRTLQDPLAESLRVVDLAADRGLLVRLMGGMAIRAHAPDWPARTRRVEVDLDFATRGRDRGAFYELLAAEGYTPDKRHNALFGGKQAYFVDTARKRPVDVLVDSLEMCHRFEFADRLALSSPTLPLAELPVRDCALTTSSPAQNMRPLPVNRITRTFLSRSASSRCVESCSSIGPEMVFIRSGRLSVIVAMWSETS